MAAALATLQVIEEDGVLENVRRMSAMLRTRLEPLTRHIDVVKAIRGRGLMIGIELSDVRALSLIQVMLLQEHRILALLTTQRRDGLRLLPPLILGESDVEWFCRAFEDVAGSY